MRFPLVAALLVTAWLPPPGAAGGTPADVATAPRIVLARGLLTVNARDTSLARLLDAIATAARIRIEASHGPVKDEKVTVAFRNLPLVEGLRRILGDRGLVLVYATRGESGPRLTEVRVYDRGQGRAQAPDRPAVASLPAGLENLVPLPARNAGVPPQRPPLGRPGRWGRGPEAVDPLVQAVLSDGDPVMRLEAARELGRTWSDRAGEPLADVLQGDADTRVREAASLALGETWSPRAVAPLGRALLQDTGRAVREAAAAALADIGGEAAARALVAGLTDPDVGVRQRVAEALGEAGDPGALPVLLEVMVRDPSVWVRDSAADAAARLMASPAAAGRAR